MKYFERIRERVKQIDSRLCVGIDAHSYLVDQENLVDWSIELANQTMPHAACFKVNTAFFESYGYKGVEAMEKVLAYISRLAPVILDAKRGDIATTAEAYAKSITRLNVDAVTINPFMGMDTIKPYLKTQPVFLLCHTSNPGAMQFQKHCYIDIAKEAAKDPNRIGLVVGARSPQVLGDIRAFTPMNWLLVPGVGKQGGDLEKTLRNGWGYDGRILINSSRTIAEAKDSGLESLKIKETINDIINQWRNNGTFF